MMKKTALILVLLIVIPMFSSAENVDLASLSMEIQPNSAAEEIDIPDTGDSEMTSSEEVLPDAASLDCSSSEVMAALNELRIIDMGSIGSVSVDITVNPDLWAYCGSQEKHVGELQYSAGKGYCALAVNPGEGYTVTTGSNREIAPVVWYSSMDIGAGTCAGFVRPNDTGTSSIYQSKLTVPDNVCCMLVQTSSLKKFPISVEKDTVVYKRVNRLADAGYITKEEMVEAISAQHDYQTEFEYFNKAGTVTIPCIYPVGEQVVCHIKPPNKVKEGNKLSSYIVYYYAINSNGVETLIASGYAYNYPVATVPEDTVAIKAAYPSNLSGTVDSLIFSIYSMALQRKPHIITVDASGYGNFTTLRQALDSITDSDLINRYEVHIYPGVYNVLDDYTEEEIKADGFIGPIVGEGVSLIGVMAGRENIVLHGELDSTRYSHSKRNDVSTLNVICTCELRNLTVSAKYIRYAIHDDMGERRYQESKHSFIDCVFRGDYLTSGDVGSRAFGAGGSHHKQYYFKNCVFQDMLYIHTQDNASGYLSCVIEDCTAKYFCVRDVNSEKNTYFHLSNNHFGMIIYRKSEDHESQYARLYSSGECSPYVYAEVPFVYEIGDTVRYLDTSIDAGYAVTSDFNVDPAVALDIAEITGISLGCIDGDTIVIRSGYVDATLFGLTDLSVGDYIGIDDTGRVTVQSNAEGAVGRVKRILGGHPFILLSF